MAKQKPSGNDLTEGVERRLKNPIIAGFIISWAIFNWRFVLFMIASPLNIQKKFVASNKYFINWWDSLVGPLIFAIILFVLIPYVSAGLHWVIGWANYGRKLADLRKKDLIKKEQTKLENLRNGQDAQILQERLTKLEQELASEKQSNKGMSDTIYAYSGYETAVRNIAEAYYQTAIQQHVQIDNQIENFVISDFKLLVQFIKLRTDARIVGRGSGTAREKLNEFLRVNDPILTQLQEKGLVGNENGVDVWNQPIRPEYWAALQRYLYKDGEQALRKGVKIF